MTDSSMSDSTARSILHRLQRDVERAGNTYIDLGLQYFSISGAMENEEDFPPDMFEWLFIAFAAPPTMMDQDAKPYHVHELLDHTVRNLDTARRALARGAVGDALIIIIDGLTEIERLGEAECRVANAIMELTALSTAMSAQGQPPDSMIDRAGREQEHDFWAQRLKDYRDRRH